MKKWLKSVICEIREQYTGALFTCQQLRAEHKKEKKKKKKNADYKTQTSN